MVVTMAIVTMLESVVVNEPEKQDAGNILIWPSLDDTGTSEL